jgi:hypothetical protein
MVTGKVMRRLARPMAAVSVLAAMVVFGPFVSAAATTPSVTIGEETLLGNPNTLIGVDEGISGMAYSAVTDGVVWLAIDDRSFNPDGSATLFAIDPVAWRLLAEVTVLDDAGQPVPWGDVEDMAAVRGGPTGGYLYLWDNENRDIVRIQEPIVSLDQEPLTVTAAVERRVGVFFPGGRRPDIETLAVDPVSDEALLVFRRRSPDCAMSLDDAASEVWRIGEVSTSVEGLEGVDAEAITGIVGRPAGAASNVFNMIGSGDISRDGHVWAVVTTPRMDCGPSVSSAAYLTFRYRGLGETWQQAIDTQLQVPIDDPRVAEAFNAEALALAPDMSGVLYAPEFRGDGGRLFWRTLEYTAPSPAGTTSTTSDAPTTSEASSTSTMVDVPAPTTTVPPVTTTVVPLPETREPFSDTAGSVFAGDIAWLAATGVTLGCNPPANDMFCPDEPVTRGQMASFLARALGLPPAEGDDVFSDDDASPHQSDIERLAQAGITRGCAGPGESLFCPDVPVSRAEMASFLARGLGLAGSPDLDPFTDDDTSVHELTIGAVAEAGVTRGCNPPTNDRYCPDDPVTRGQMAAFLHRAADLIDGARAERGLPPLG